MRMMTMTERTSLSSADKLIVVGSVIAATVC